MESNRFSEQNENVMASVNLRPLIYDSMLNPQKNDAANSTAADRPADASSVARTSSDGKTLEFGSPYNNEPSDRKSCVVGPNSGATGDNQGRTNFPATPKEHHDASGVEAGKGMLAGAGVGAALGLHQFKAETAKKLGVLNESVAKASTHLESVNSQIVAEKSIIKENANVLKTMQKDVSTELAKNAERPQMLDVLKRQKEFFQKELPKAKMPQINEVIGSKEQVLSGDKIIEEGSEAAKAARTYRREVHIAKSDPVMAAEKPWENTRKEFLDTLKQEAKATKAEVLSEKNLGKLSLKSDLLEEVVKGGRTDAIKEAIGKSASEIKRFPNKVFLPEEGKSLINLSESLDKFKFLTAESKSAALSLDAAKAALTPAAGASTEWLGKTLCGASKGFLVAGGAFAAGLAVDTLVGNAMGKDAQGVYLKNVFAPNWIEAAGMTGAALAPLPLPLKAGVAGLAWLAGRGYNIAAQSFGWDKAKFELA